VAITVWCPCQRRNETDSGRVDRCPIPDHAATVAFRPQRQHGGTVVLPLTVVPSSYHAISHASGRGRAAGVAGSGRRRAGPPVRAPIGASSTLKGMPSIGESLAGRYRLDAVIGSGGFATVFRARDLRLRRDVAVKVLLANHVTDPVVAARFEQEARVLAAISHPNVVAIHDVAPGDPGVGDEPFLVMDLCEGGSLADRLAASGNGALQPDEIISILEDITAGLAALHAVGIVHRDLKPSNILLSDGRARIADLGIAVAGPSELTAVGTTIGTLVYLAPEQRAGEPASPASDVHALGVVAFLGLTGTLPRPAGSVTEVVAASNLPVRLVSAVQPGLGSAFDTVIASALSVDPARRPTAADLGTMLASALERWRARPGPVAPVWGAPASAAGDDATTVVDVALPRYDESTAEGAASPQREGRLVAVAGALLAALFLGLVGYLLLGFGGSGGRASPPGAGGSMGPSASARVSPTAGPTPSTTPSTAPTPSPTPSPVPTATVDSYGNARAASDEMGAAIAAARGPGGLNGHEPKDLADHLAGFDRALDKRDAKAARDEAVALAAQVAKLIGEGAVDAQVGARLGTAADLLVEAANALPD